MVGLWSHRRLGLHRVARQAAPDRHTDALRSPDREPGRPFQSRTRRPDPRHVVKKGKTPVLTAGETPMLFDAIDTETIMGKRDSAIIGTLHKSP